MPMLLLHRLVNGALPAIVFTPDEIEQIEILVLGGLVRADLHLNSAPSTRGDVITATVFQVTENGRRMATAFPSCESMPAQVPARVTVSVSSARASAGLARVDPQLADAALRQ